MKHLIFACGLWALGGVMSAASGQTDSLDCALAIDQIDEFDSTLLVVAKPVTTGILIPTKNMSEELDGPTFTDEAKLLVSFAEGTDGTRSFFMTIVTPEYEYMKTEDGYNVFFKLDDGTYLKVWNVAHRAEYNRDLLMWMYYHTCVLPPEAYHMLRNGRVEKIRINYPTLKKTLNMTGRAQAELKRALACVWEAVKRRAVRP